MQMQIIISLYSYIKPQHQGRPNCVQLAVYPYIPTSNRNWKTLLISLRIAVYPYIPTSNRNHIPFGMTTGLLYILIFLHQTATAIVQPLNFICCISLYSYIKPQRHRDCGRSCQSCISLYSYIKPQLDGFQPLPPIAVYPYIPTSNRNNGGKCPHAPVLYILIFLHQTATRSAGQHVGSELYILIFLHQTATEIGVGRHHLRCISLYSYIKPQLKHSLRSERDAVYPYIPTSNRNSFTGRYIPFWLYILIFLHQTATCNRCC